MLLDVQQFESALGQSATVEINWQVRSPKGEPTTGRSFVREPTGGTTYGELVAAHSRALALVSRDIAAAIRQSDCVAARKDPAAHLKAVC